MSRTTALVFIAVPLVALAVLGAKTEWSGRTGPGANVSEKTNFAPASADTGGISTATTVTLGTDYSDLNALFAYLKGKRINAQLTVNIPEGSIDHSTVAVFDHPDARNIKFVGTSSVITISSVGTIASTAAFNHSVVLNLASAAGISVGHFISIRAGAIGDIASSWLEGTWRVTAVSGNAVTVRVTDARTSLAAPTVSNVTAFVQKSVLRWNSANSGGIAFWNVAPGLFEHIVFDGQYDITVPAPDAATDGIIIATTAHNTAGVPGEHQIGLSAVTMRYCSIVRWRSNGAYVNNAGTLDLTNSNICSNGWRGTQAVGSGAAIYGKSCVVSGNRKSGTEFELGGSINHNNSTFAGNGEQGLYGSLGGFGIAAGRTRMIGNLVCGCEIKDGGTWYLEGAVFRNNGPYQARAFGPGSQICVDGCNTAGATTAAFQELNGGIVYDRGTKPSVAEATRWALESVTQQTNKSTAVTINQRKGRIVTHNETMSSGNQAFFTLNDRCINEGDVVSVSLKSGAAGYQLNVDNVQEGSCRICIFNRSAGTESAALEINFNVD